jgi:hypothetical protein
MSSGNASWIGRKSQSLTKTVVVRSPAKQESYGRSQLFVELNSIVDLFIKKHQS